MAKDKDRIEEQLDIVIELLRHMLALQLSEKGVKQLEIGKHLHVATATVGKLLNGVKHGG
ncbi:hypothetical protein [Bradyrhizobium sp. TM239]|uniref:hypothetical protein n=1 Tax=Bradyrhizobium sp. TM239 TaxID=2599802 RepID=UPI0027D4DF85|nr:hypothetical protein TM239_29090 [Bradyrhizobium sp. TM239]